MVIAKIKKAYMTHCHARTVAIANDIVDNRLGFAKLGKKGNLGGLTSLSKEVLTFVIMLVVGFILLAQLGGLSVVSGNENATAAVNTGYDLMNTLKDNASSIVSVVIVAIIVYILYRAFFSGGGMLGGRQ